MRAVTRHGGRSIAFGACGAILLLLAANPATVQADVLKGVVRRTDGSPVGGADFDVFAPDGTLLPQDDNSDADGTYLIVLPPGYYDMVCEPSVPSGLAPQIRRGLFVAGETREDWELVPAVRVLGRVFDPGGAPVAQVDLDFDRADDGKRQPAVGDLTNAFGSFAASVEPGTYLISAFPPAGTGLAPTRIGPFTISSADTLRFDLIRAVRFDGQVRGPAGEGIEGVRITFTSESSGLRIPANGHVTLADGRFDATLAPGTYRVDFSPPPEVDLVAERIQSLDLHADRSLDIELMQGFRISGLVLDEMSRPLPEADWDAVDVFTGLAVPTPHDNTGYDGRYAFVVADGTYTLILSPPVVSGLPSRSFPDVAVTAPIQLDVFFATEPPSELSLRPTANPGHTAGSLLIELPAEGPTIVDVFDVSGRRVRRLIDQVLPAGRHIVQWDGRDDGGVIRGPTVYYVVARQRASRATTKWVVLP